MGENTGAEDRALSPEQQNHYLQGVVLELQAALQREIDRNRKSRCDWDCDSCHAHCMEEEEPCGDGCSAGWGYGAGLEDDDDGDGDAVFTVEQCTQAQEAFEQALLEAMMAPLEEPFVNRSCMRGPGEDI